MRFHSKELAIEGDGTPDELPDLEQRTERTQSIDSQKTDITRFSLDGVCVCFFPFYSKLTVSLSTLCF